MGKTKIQWTDLTWQTLIGCSESGPECFNCYAKIAANSPRLQQFPQYQGIGAWDGTINYAESQLLKPFNYLKPSKIFANSMGDTYHPNQNRDNLDEVHAVIALCNHHQFQLLTKHPKSMQKYHEELTWERLYNAALRFWTPDRVPGKFYKSLILQDYFQNLTFPLSNLWLGTSVGWQKSAWRIDWLRKTSAAFHFLSCEPLIEPLGGKMELDLTGIEWLIIGGESGFGSDIRPFHIEHARSLIQQCRAQGVALFFKQAGRLPHEKGCRVPLKSRKGDEFDEFPYEWNDLKIQEFPQYLSWTEWTPLPSKVWSKLLRI